MNKRNKIIIPIALGIGCLPWVILFGIIFIAIVGAATRMPGGDKVALIQVSGPISSGSGGDSLFGVSAGASRIIEHLEKAKDDEDVKAIVLRIDSPGGSAAASQEIYEQVMRVRKSGKVVVTSMGDVAASGGYYIAAASDKIYANGSTVTGSIGVIMSAGDMSELFDKLGINYQIMKSGKHKDMGSSHRQLTAEEKQILQALIDDVFSQFVTAVSQGRKMPESEVRRVADGRIFTGRQAKKLGLVDQIGGLRDATLAAARQAGIKGEPSVVEYGGSRWESLLGTSAGSRTLGLSPTEDMILRRLLQAAPDLMQ